MHFGREICGDLEAATAREWLVTNGTGSFASGTIAGIATRRYHGLLIAALQPPLGRTLLVAKFDETIRYWERSYPLFANRWHSGTVDPQGYHQIESFRLHGTIAIWTFACGDALIDKQIWMQPGVNTTYVRYCFRRGSAPLSLCLKALVNYRNHHYTTASNDWQMNLEVIDRGVCIRAFDDAVPYYLKSDRANMTLHHQWHLDFDLAVERYRGLGDREDHLHAATFEVVLNPGESLTLAASTEPHPILDGEIAFDMRQQYEQKLLRRWYSSPYVNVEIAPPWVEHLVLAADQFIVDRPAIDSTIGKTIIAGYPWFGDWGRDMAIALPGLALATGRPEIARIILRTFAHYLNRGMLPNMFPDEGNEPDYNTVDAILWYFEAIRACYAATGDEDTIAELYPALQEVIHWHREGTRYNIHLDDDGLIYAGETGQQLTWMDAKVDDWVVTPRIGKPVEVNALWYNALVAMAHFAHILGQPATEYERMARQTVEGFQRFWNSSAGYCYDVLDTPTGNDAKLRPNQILAVSLPATDAPLLICTKQQKQVVDIVGRSLLSSYGLRSLAPEDPQYIGHYGGDRVSRDAAYHQGTVWSWLIGHYVQAHFRVYGDRALARTFLMPMEQHLHAAGIGSISEIFDGDAPFTPRGCIAQAWSVAEVLRAWLLVREV